MTTPGIIHPLQRSLAPRALGLAAAGGKVPLSRRSPPANGSPIFILFSSFNIQN